MIRSIGNRIKNEIRVVRTIKKEVIKKRYTGWRKRERTKILAPKNRKW